MHGSALPEPLPHDRDPTEGLSANTDTDAPLPVDRDGDTAAPDPERASLADAVDSMARAGSGQYVSLGELLAALETRSSAPALLLPGIVLLSPLSGVPLIPSLCAVLTVIITLQLLFHRQRIRLPARLEAIRFRRGRTDLAVRRVHRPARRLDVFVRRRYRLAVHPRVYDTALVLCLLLGVMMPVTEFVPFSSTILGAALSALALALMTGNGLLMIVGVSILLAFTLVAAPSLIALVSVVEAAAA